MSTTRAKFSSACAPPLTRSETPFSPAARPTPSTMPPANSPSAAKWASTPPKNSPAKGSSANGRRSSKWTALCGKRLIYCFPQAPWARPKLKTEWNEVNKEGAEEKPNTCGHTRGGGAYCQEEHFSSFPSFPSVKLLKTEGRSLFRYQ